MPRPIPSQPKPGSLGELQRLMARAIMRPLTRDDRMQPRWEDGRSTGEVANAFIKPNDRLDSFDRLEIYNRQYWFRLLDCLHDDYPGLHAILGTSRFHRLITAYLVKYPSASATLRDLGDRLGAFLEEEPSLTRPHQTLARDMVCLEWAQVVAFDSASRRPASARHFSGKTPDQIFLRLQPFISLLDLTFPVDQVLIRILRQGGRLRGEASNAMESLEHPSQRSIAGSIKPRRSWLLVHRQNNSVFFKKLTEPQYLILHTLDAGGSLASSIEVVKGLPDAVQNIQAWFQNWASLGLLISPRG